MTTLIKLTAQIKRLLSGGTTPKDSKLNDAYIKAEIIQVTNGLLKIQHFENMEEGYRDAQPLCIATYASITVVNDTTRKRNYCVLPAYPMNLPGGVGVQQVKPQTGLPVKDVAMIPIQPHEYEMFKSLLVGSELMKDLWTYEVDRNKIWFTKKSDKTLLESNITLVEAKIVVHDPAQILDTDPYPVPPEMEMAIIKEVLMLHGYAPQKAADLINNDNPNN